MTTPAAWIYIFISAKLVKALPLTIDILILLDGTCTKYVIIIFFTDIDYVMKINSTKYCSFVLKVTLPSKY